MPRVLAEEGIGGTLVAKCCGRTRPKKHKSPIGWPHAVGHVMPCLQHTTQWNYPNKANINSSVLHSVPMEKCKHGARSNFQRTCRFSALAVRCQAMLRFQKQFPTCSDIILQNSQSCNNATCTISVEKATFSEQNLVQPECFCQVSWLTTIHWSAGSYFATWLRSHSAFLFSLISGLFLFSLVSSLLFPFLYIFFAVTIGKPVLLIFMLSITLPLSPGIFICITPETKLHQRSYILPVILKILQYVQNMK